MINKNRSVKKAQRKVMLARYPLSEENCHVPSHSPNSKLKVGPPSKLLLENKLLSQKNIYNEQFLCPVLFLSLFLNVRILKI